MSDNLSGVVLAPADDMLSTSGMAHPGWVAWRTAFGDKLVPGVLTSFPLSPTHPITVHAHMRELFKGGVYFVQHEH